MPDQHQPLVEYVPAVEAEITVTLGDMLEGYEAAGHYWQRRIGGRSGVIAIVVSRAVHHVPTVLAGAVAVAELGGTGWAGGAARWLHSLVAYALPIAVYAFYMGVIPGLKRRMLAGSRSRLLKAVWPSLDQGGVPVRIRLTPHLLEFQTSDGHLAWQQGGGGLAMETPRCFVAVQQDVIRVIPLRSLNAAQAADARNALLAWSQVGGGARKLATMPRPRPVWAFATHLADFIGIGFWAVAAAHTWTQGAERARAVPATERVSIVVERRTVLVADEVLPILDGLYTIRAGSSLHDSLSGGIHAPQVRGRFYVERETNGFRPYALQEVPRIALRGSDSVGRAPDDADVTALPDGGVLMVWERSSGDGVLHTCAKLFAYRAALPVAAQAYRRALRLEFCSGTLDRPALASWMNEAAQAVDETFTGFARR